MLGAHRHIAGLLFVFCVVLCVASYATVATAESSSPVETAESDISTPLFELDVLPVLTAAGCNAGACHGKARGQNGFALSLLGFDPDFDFDSIVQQARGRRVFPAAADNSLLLLKATGYLPHGGGERIAAATPEYEIVRRWIAAGAPRAGAEHPTLVDIHIAPDERVLRGSEQQQLMVTAQYSDGSTRDVTRFTNFESNESAVVAVDRLGLVTAGELPGEASIMARYMGRIATWNTAIPLPGAVDDSYYGALPRHNFIDELVWDKLQELHITPSQPASDSQLLRRMYLDIIGRLPKPDEARAYLADTSPHKRGDLIESLLARPEYADYWANKWVDLLRPNPYRVGIKATRSLDAWVREAFRDNRPYDQFVRGLVTAQGSTWHNGAVTMFRDRRTPDEITTMVSQLFLGTRLECAKCHQHPFEVWGQTDFYSLAAYFARVGYKGTGLSPPISGGEEIVFTAANGDVRHPLTGEILAPRPLYGTAREVQPDDDPREVLMEWMLSDGKFAFARVAVNRVWADLMARGLVEPVDDLRATNPPSNAALLDALAQDFIDGGYDLKSLLRTITASYVYGLSSLPNEQNISDTLNYSRHYRQRLRAEVLLDAIGDVAEAPQTLSAMPAGARAVELWTHRIDSLFLDAFGRPDPNQDPPCERTTDTTVVQALHLMNSPQLHSQIAHDTGRAARLASSDLEPGQIVDELYLAAYARYPDASERENAVALYQAEGVDRRAATEDLLWALVNTPEFVFKD